MLALAIIATVILSIMILAFFGEIVTDADDVVLGFTLITLLGFVIVTIWVLYAR